LGIYKKNGTKILWMSKCINGIQYQKSTGSDSKMRAKAAYEEWVADLKEQIRTGKLVITTVKEETKAELAFSELANKWTTFINGRLKSAYNTGFLVKKLVERFKDKRLSGFTMQDLELLQNDWVNMGFSIAYANRLVSAVKRMFAKAVDWELIGEDVLKRIRKVKPLKGENKRLRYLTDEESERLIGNCELYLRPIVITALNTGMRKSEIFGLTWDRVDLRNRVILLDKTKNGERREIPINEMLYDTLSNLPRNIGGYVFANPKTGKRYDNLKRSWHTALRKSHILDFHFHDLRHTFASWLVMKGADIATVRDLMGHKDIKMTLRYSHLSHAHIKKAVSLLDKLDVKEKNDSFMTAR
jgi:integrase